MGESLVKYTYKVDKLKSSFKWFDSCVESILICATQFHYVKSLEIVQEIT
jgi:virulence-associated protein VapD